MTIMAAISPFNQDLSTVRMVMTTARIVTTTSILMMMLVSTTIIKLMTMIVLIRIYHLKWKSEASWPTCSTRCV